MKNVFLITTKNEIFRKELNNSGYIVKELDNLLLEDEIQTVDNNLPGDYTIIEIDEEKIKELADIVIKFNRLSVRIIAIVNKETANIRSFLIENGISDVIFSFDAKLIINYIDLIDRKVQLNYGKILILEDYIPRLNILKTIIRRFHYEPVITGSIDDLYDNLEKSNFQLILVNLGAIDFDICYLIKRSLSSKEIKKAPVIPYKDTDEGLFIHEITAGLNRLAKIILSSGELYSFLVDILFKKELSTVIGHLKETIAYDDLIQFSGESLQRLYYSLGDNLFPAGKILAGDGLEKLSDVINSINETKNKVEGLRWLVLNDKLKSPIGVGF